MPIEQYKQNLEKIILRLKKTKAKLIWASTTPIPKEWVCKNCQDSNRRFRSNDDVFRYNKVATEIMKQHSIPINDLGAFVLEKLSELLPPDDLHPNAESSEVLGKQVSNMIREELESNLKPL